MALESFFEDLLKRVPQRFNWVRDVWEVRANPEAPLLELLDGQQLHTVLVRHARQQADGFLNWLRREGVAQGDTVFVLCGVHAGLWTTYLSVIKGGLVMVPAAGILTAEDIAYRFELRPPRVIVTDQENLAKIEKALTLSRIAAPLCVLVEELPSASGNAEAADTGPDDPLFIFFTSGTTGMPKMVVHTQASYPLGHLSTAAWIGLRSGDRHCNVAQPGWAKFAWSSFFAPLNAGATVFCVKQSGRFDAPGLLQALQDYRVSTFCAPPTALRLLIQEDLTAYKFSLRECVSAGEPLNPEVIEAWQQGTGLTLRDGYGQTETTCMVGNLPGVPLRRGSMGHPTFLYDVVIADEEGAVLPPNIEGQIAVRLGSGFRGVFKEYLGRETDVFRHGLYYTGDKAYRDEDGYLWFVGRDDDVIKSSDYRVGPFEVESVLLEIEEVRESAVIGIPHPVKGAEVKAYLVTSADVEPERVFAYCRERLAAYKRPRRIEFVDELPKTISGKIRRLELRQAESARPAADPLRPREFCAPTEPRRRPGEPHGL
jgi:acyl-coenzyme A synthetase/AMP-(fatty) acid ligase